MVGVEADSLKRSRDAATLRPMPADVGGWGFHSGLLPDEDDDADEDRRDRGGPAVGEDLE